MIADLGSRNGVRVNGRAVPSARLGLGDVVRLGGWIGVVTATPGELEEIAPGLWGGAGLQEALATLRQAAASDLPIVLEGETGTGKEVVAGALHRWSGRAGPLVAVNCAALPESLAEGELFGYRRGAFTGADRASPGFFRSAEGGTLLLDEVSDLPLALQAKLLRVLEQREVQPLGETRPVPIDVRIVVAGQQPLMEVVRAGRFRADLLARLDGLTVRLPPLRERREDVIPLFSHLLREIGQGRAPAIESDFAERLCAARLAVQRPRAGPARAAALGASPHRVDAPRRITSRSGSGGTCGVRFASELSAPKHALDKYADRGGGGAGRAAGAGRRAAYLGR